MAALRLPLVLVVSWVLLTPGAVATSGQGQLESGSIQLAPDTTMTTSGISLLYEGSGLPEMAFEGAQVAIQRYGTRDAAFSPVVSGTASGVNERSTHTTARLTLVPKDGESRIALRSAGPAEGIVGASDARAVEGALLMALPGRGSMEGGAGCPSDDPYSCIDVFGAYEIGGDAMELTIAGELYMLIYGPTLVVEDAKGRTEYASGRIAIEETGPVTRYEDATIIVRATSGVGRLVGEATVFATAPTLRTTSVTFHDATGAVRVGARDYRASGDDVAAVGDLVITPGPVAHASENNDERTGTIYAASMTSRVSGDIESIDLEGNIAFLDTPAEKAGAAAVILAVIGGAAYAWQHLAFAAAALYTRLSKPDILENDVRNHIYDIIRLNPGISAREVHRRSQQSWGTVVYHLRQLERHHLVVSRALGRTRNYYENHGKYKGMEAQLACLQSDRARILARAIAAQPGITQEQLAIAAALPQPTTSYYVRKLKQAGLVHEEREGRYVKYVPHADLPRFIELSESSVQSGAAAGSGVQA